MSCASAAPGIALFAQLVADVDAAHCADAVQSYFGISFDLGRLAAGGDAGT